MPRTPFDEYAKDVTHDAQRPFGEVEADARITADATLPPKPRSS